MRFVVLNDIHVEPDVAGAKPRNAALGFARALQTIHRLTPKPEFLITAGDHIMDALEASPTAVKAQWDLYEATLKANATLPIFPMIGNHDILGWMNTEVHEYTRGYGKSMALRRLGMDQSHYSFDRGGWHFVLLDNIQRQGQGYCGATDDDQMDWLKRDLEKHGDKPTMVLSHIPIISACASLFLEPSAGVTFWQIPHVFVQTDAQALVDLLAKHNVRLAVSGHLHMCEKIDYRGITFICNGAICANWWQGPFKSFDAGFGVFDLSEDGTFSYQYQTFL